MEKGRTIIKVLKTLFALLYEGLGLSFMRHSLCRTCLSHGSKNYFLHVRLFLSKTKYFVNTFNKTSSYIKLNATLTFTT